MEHKRLIVIVPDEALGAIEEQLRRMRVGGVTVSKVRGYGEYKNLFSRDWMSAHTKIELFVEAVQVDAVLDGLVELSRGAPPGAGIVAVLPVERFVHLRTGTDTLPVASPVDGTI